MRHAVIRNRKGQVVMVRESDIPAGAVILERGLNSSQASEYLSEAAGKTSTERRNDEYYGQNYGYSY